MENEKEVEIQESSFKLYLKCFEKLTAKERDILMDCLKLEIIVAGWMMGVIHRKDEQNDRSNPE